ncbi:MAG: hypothetical protein QNJ23_06510 [Woeseiaceae bacterium]|nr:hypothetical protein [Woeseiaceae bacterium]
MKARVCALLAVAIATLLTACDNDTGDGFVGPNNNGGGVIVPPGGGAGSLGVAALVYAEAPGNTGFDDALVNGDGTIAVFMQSSDPLGTNPGGEEQLFSMVFGDPAPIQLTSGTGGGFRSTDDFDINSGGTTVVFVSDQDITGDNAANALNVFAAATDGSSVTQVTSSTAGDIAEPGISGDGSLIVFTSSEDLTGGNPMNDTQIFSIAADGSNLTQVTTGATAAESVVLSDDGTKLAWVDTSDPFGTNADGSREIFAMNVDGTNHMQLSDSAGDSITPRISDDGAYVIFVSAGEFTAGSNADGMLEVYTVNTDGTGMTRITNSGQDSGLRFNGSAPAVDISGDGNYITFMSYGDFNGINTGGTYTVYWATRDGTTLQQLLRLETKPDGVSSLAAEVPRMSDDGSRIMFNALAPYSADAPDSGWKIFVHSRL